jgi:hypothetical protein
MHSPAEIVRSCLVDLGIVMMPMVPGKLIPYGQLPDTDLMLCYVSSMPDEMERGVLITDSVGEWFGRIMDDGKYMQHPGIKMVVRTQSAADYGYVRQNLCSCWELE